MIRIVILSLLMLAGCDTVDTHNSIHYEDGRPVVNAKVVQKNEQFKGVTSTDENGNWTLTLPEDVIVDLCIDDPENGNKPACYDGYLIVPTAESGDTELIGVEK